MKGNYHINKLPELKLHMGEHQIRNWHVNGQLHSYQLNKLDNHSM